MSDDTTGLETSEEVATAEEDAAPGKAVEQDAAERDSGAAAPPAAQPARRLALLAVPALAVAAAAGAGFLGWKYASAHEAENAAAESVDAARDTTSVILSYTPETVDAQLNGARDRLTGGFLDSYTKLVNDVVIPGAKEKKITAVARVAAASSVSATKDHAVALLFVNQTVNMGADAPTTTNSSVRVTLDKVGDRWLVSGFDPV